MKMNFILFSAKYCSGRKIQNSYNPEMPKMYITTLITPIWKIADFSELGILNRMVTYLGVFSLVDKVIRLPSNN